MAERGFSFFFRRGCRAAQIRAVQVGGRLGARINPASGYEEDVCICVKVRPSKVLRERPRHLYLDVVDNGQLNKWLRAHPTVPAILTTDLACSVIARNPTVVIPQHHCNVERTPRMRDKVTTVGYIGVPDAIEPYREELEAALAHRGMTLEVYGDYHSRADVVRFYQRIDVQLAFRIPLPVEWLLFKDSLKLANAGSFGIPTIARPEPSFEEGFADCYLRADTVPDVLTWIDRLRDDPTFYARMALLARERAEDVHLDRIIPLYRALP